MDMSLLMVALPIVVLALVILVSFLLLAYQSARFVPWFSFLGLVFSLASLTLFSVSGQGDSGAASNPITNAQFTHVFSVPVSFSTHIVVDGFTRLHVGLMLLSGLVSSLLLQQRNEAKNAINQRAMLHISMLLMVFGAVLAVSANGLLVLFLGLEVMGLGVMGLLFFSSVASVQDNTNSKHQNLMQIRLAFLRHTLSMSVFLFGFALLFAYSGGLTYDDMNVLVVDNLNHPLLLLGGVLVLFSLFYQLAFFPMQSWFFQLQKQMNLYVWFPVILIGFYAVFVSLVRLLISTGLPMVDEISIVLMILVILGLLFTSLSLFISSSTQPFVSNLVMASMAYAFVVILVLGQGSVMMVNMSMLGMVMGMLLIGLSMQGLLARLPKQDGAFATLSGSYHYRPKLTLLFCLGLLTLIGLPLTIGFMGKFYTFLAVVTGLNWFLVAVVIISTVMMWVAVAKFIQLLFMAPEEVVNDRKKIGLLKRTKLVVVLVVVSIVGFGMYPEPLIQLAQLASIV